MVAGVLGMELVLPQWAAEAVDVASLLIRFAGSRIHERDAVVAVRYCDSCWVCAYRGRS